MEVYKRSQGKYKRPTYVPKDTRYHVLKQKNLNTEERETLGVSGDEKIPDPFFDIRAKMYDMKKHKKHEKEKKLHGTVPELQKVGV